MRNEFVKLFVEQYKSQDKEIYFLTGDLGYRVLEPIRDVLGTNFINVGIAEQNMVGVAAGLAMTGKKVFIYSIVNFATLRCLEQLRNDVCYHDLDVTVVIVGGGFAYGTHGYTHLGLEDISSLMHLPNIKIFSPGDKKELSKNFSSLLLNDGPQYIRMARGGEPDFSHEIECSLIDDKEVTDIIIFSHGPIGQNGIDAAKELSKFGHKAKAVSVPFILPFPETKVKKLLKTCKVAMVIEEHAVGGALGAKISIAGASLGPKCPVVKCLGVTSEITKVIGKSEFLRSKFSLDVNSIVKCAIGLLKDVKSEI